MGAELGAIGTKECLRHASIKAAIGHIPDNAWTPIKYPNAIFDEDEGRWISEAEVAEISTDSPLPMLDAESDHRGHAIVEQVIADLKNSALAHLPSASFAANSAWLVCAAIAFNLTRATRVLASTFHAKATTATIGAQLVAVPARIARSARRMKLHLPRNWPWEHDFAGLFDHATVANGATHSSLRPGHRPTRPDRRKSGKAGQTGEHRTPPSAPGHKITGETQQKTQSVDRG